MWRWLKSLFAWRKVEGIGGPIWTYSENTITGARKAIRHGGCYQPLNHDWLDGGCGRPIIIDLG